MTTYPSTSARGPTRALRQIAIAADRVSSLTKGSAARLMAFTISYLSVLGLASFVIAGFLINVPLGFVVLGVCLLILHKAVERERA